MTERAEQCVQCHEMVTDWVDPDWANGRVCRDCDAMWGAFERIWEELGWDEYDPDDYRNFFVDGFMAGQKHERAEQLKQSIRERLSDDRGSC